MAGEGVAGRRGGGAAVAATLLGLAAAAPTLGSPVARAAGVVGGEAEGGRRGWRAPGGRWVAGDGSSERSGRPGGEERRLVAAPSPGNTHSFRWEPAEGFD